jgi:iron complex outermembrane receptor protein
MKLSLCRGRLLFQALVVLVGLGLSFDAAWAQDPATLRGFVRAERTGLPVTGAEVRLVGTELTALSSVDGRYEVIGVPIGHVLVQVSHSDFVTVVEQVYLPPSPSTYLADFQLQAPEFVLEELLVKAERTERTSGAVLEGKDLEEGATSLNNILDRVSGVHLIRTGGEVGSGWQLRIRGSSSFRFNGPPVVYLNGVRVRVEGSDGGSGILELLNPETIGRVELQRGASAEARYGPDATNGVIIITTKTGGGR